eukprot:c28558_g1_i1.p1 GENE.c28558_g1_i1~~c28558_g1_i1.p1  ORF type:complete len:279 (+),score=80.53 c28558_g1_i1:52-888(+)
MGCFGEYTTNKGNHYPKYGGICVVAKVDREDDLIWVSILLILIPTIISFPAVNHFYDDKLAFILDITTACTCFFTLLTLSLAHFIEPGILNVKQHSVSNEYRIVHPKTGELVDFKEYRAKFCRETDNCIENFDHYCPWISNAVGIRNYTIFFTFVSSTILYNTYLAIISWILFIDQVTHPHHDLKIAVKNTVGSAFEIVYTIAIFCTIGPLFFYHISLISTNVTTNESLKEVYLNRAANPHDKGCLKNWIYFFASCGTRRPTLVSDSHPPILADKPMV